MKRSIVHTGWKSVKNCIYIIITEEYTMWYRLSQSKQKLSHDKGMFTLPHENDIKFQVFQIGQCDDHRCNSEWSLQQWQEGSLSEARED